MDVGKIVRIVVGLVVLAALVAAMALVLPEYQGAGQTLLGRMTQPMDNGYGTSLHLTDSRTLLALFADTTGFDFRAVGEFLAGAVLAFIGGLIAWRLFERAFGD